MNNTNFKTLLNCIRDMIKRNRVAYKDYIGNGEYEIKKLPDELLSDNVAKTGDVKKINRNINSINSDISGINSDISGINSDISGINSDISGINSDISGINSDITELKKNKMPKIGGTIQSLCVTDDTLCMGDFLCYGNAIISEGLRVDTIDTTYPTSVVTKYYVDAKISDTEIFLTSSTADSAKKFKITVNDEGVLTATEV